MVINNVISGAQEVSMNYLTKDKIWTTTKTGTYTIDVTELDFGEVNLLSSINALRDVYKTKLITARIAGHDYVNADFVSLSFEESALIGSALATLVIQKTEGVLGLGGPLDLLRPADIESFSEKFNFQRSDNNYTKSRTLDVKYKKNAHTNDSGFIEEVKTQLNGYFSATQPNYGFQVDGISENFRANSSEVGEITEKVDIINLSFSFSDVFSSGKKDASLPVGVKKTYVLSLDPQGFETKQYNIDLYSLASDLESIKTSTRDIINKIVLDEGTSPLSVSKGFDVNGRVANININFSNNPNDTGGNKISFFVARNEKSGVTSYSLNLEFTTDVGDTKTEKFNNVIAYWKSTEKTSDQAYVKRLFPLDFSPDVTLYEVSRDTSFDKSTVSVSDAIVFSLDNAFNSNAGIVSYKLSATTDNIKDQEYRNNIIIDVADNANPKPLVSTNKKKKTTSLTGNLNVSFTEDKRDTILTYMREAARFVDIETKVKDITTLQNLIITSDNISIDLDSYSASRTVSFNAY